MNLTIKAILARFGGNYNDAITYCNGIAENHPALAKEYRSLIDLIRLESTRRRVEVIKLNKETL